MYIHSLRLWNWRKFSEGQNGECGVEVEFNKGLNIIVGENDSGKTAIIDAIKTVLSTNNQDVSWVTEQDFYVDSKSLKIECIFRNLSQREEAFFYEWLTITPEKTELRVVMEAEIYEDINKQRKVKKIVKAGSENLESGMEDTVRQLLSVTYLKPLRDAATELSPGKRSRIAQVVKNLSDFADYSPEQKQIIDSFSSAFDELKAILNEPVLSKIGKTVDHFFEDNNKKVPEIISKEMSFVEILRKLELNLGEVGTGLGSSNLLFMAVELLLLSESEVGPKIALIEEVEAHIHPQAQLRVIKHFEKNSKNTGIQYIFTSHSPILASSISLESIIFIYNKQAYPMKKGYTKLQEEDYEFLERFLDATKANMFFAQGIIFVEGDAENLLLPAVAEVIGRPLHRYGVSVINVGNLAFKRYTSIFLRSHKNKQLNFPVSIITDLDLKPVDYYDEPCYIKIDEELNRQIANLYGCDEIESEFQKIYVNCKDVYNKSKVLYGKKIENLSGDELTKKFKEINAKIIELLKVTEPKFDEYKEKKESEIKKRYFNGIEKTRVFISKPWTFEHSIALSGLRDDFENILLGHYDQEKNRLNKKKEWETCSEKNKRATAVYTFLLEKEISKAVVAQQFAKYLLDNKEKVKEVLLSDESLKHLISAIYHVTGGEDGAN
ncbi:DNA replication and repair protein RecF [Bacillus licheniformis]|uniref:ATP-dependent nuclease n=1 Tax=Bacillus haynesii TaxID=1925021 RepID=UPI00130B890A|nr:AAA family ATPase [Bacillus haynesii]MCY8377811.1 AAA family ATPase [Bacillus haynesii]MEC0676400.1 AAA family ATPase [Bacillus haynesii]TWK12064.1 DNA replication and repair protein RecF [Bacillus licheniformis]